MRMMMMGEDALFNLRWDAQRSALLGSMASLYREEAFVDTTIVADNKIFKAHKLLLSASSSYLRSILESVPASQHAVICMPQVSSIDMGNLLRFIYEGQIKISRRSLRPFLATAKLLRIKGMDFELNEDLDAALPPPSNNNNFVQNTSSCLPSPLSAKRPAPPPSASSQNGETNNNVMDDSNKNNTNADDEPPSSKRASPSLNNPDEDDEGGRKSPVTGSNLPTDDDNGAEAPGDDEGDPERQTISNGKSKTGSVTSSPSNNNNSSESNNNLERSSSSRSLGEGSTHSGEMEICSDAEESNQSMEPLQLISLSRLAAASKAAQDDNENSEGALNLVDHHGDSHSHGHSIDHHRVTEHLRQSLLTRDRRFMMGDDDRDDRDEIMSNGGAPDYDDDDDDDQNYSMSIQPEVSLRESDESYSVHSNDRRSHHSSPHSALEIKHVPNLLNPSAFAGLPIGGNPGGISMTPFNTANALHNLQALKNFNKLRPLIPKAHQQHGNAAAVAAAAAATQFQSMSEDILKRIMTSREPSYHLGGVPSGTGNSCTAPLSTKLGGGGSSSSSSSVLSHPFDLSYGDSPHHTGSGGVSGGSSLAAGLRKQKRYVQCTSCSKVLSSLSALKRHMEDVHCARIQGKCLLCGRVYSSRNSLLTHVYSAHKKHHDYKAVARIIRESDFEQFATA